MNLGKYLLLTILRTYSVLVAWVSILMPWEYEELGYSLMLAYFFSFLNKIVCTKINNLSEIKKTFSTHETLANLLVQISLLFFYSIGRFTYHSYPLDHWNLLSIWAVELIISMEISSFLPLLSISTLYIKIIPQSIKFLMSFNCRFIGSLYNQKLLLFHMWIMLYEKP